MNLGVTKIQMYVCAQGIVLYLNLSNSHFHKQNQGIWIGNWLATYVMLV